MADYRCQTARYRSVKQCSQALCKSKPRLWLYNTKSRFVLDWEFQMIPGTVEGFPTVIKCRFVMFMKILSWESPRLCCTLQTTSDELCLLFGTGQPKDSLTRMASLEGVARDAQAARDAMQSEVGLMRKQLNSALQAKAAVDKVPPPSSPHQSPLSSQLSLYWCHLMHSSSRAGSP